MMRKFLRLVGDTRAAAAAEMALVVPFLLALLFGSVELGYYFQSEHVVDKAVRDAARYAGRLPIGDFDCSVPSVDATAMQQIQRVARFGDPDGTSNARLIGWTSDEMTAVSLSCDTDTTHSYVNNGLYVDFPSGVPVITVRATVPYPTLFGMIGLGSLTFNLNATQQAAVFGA
jgi:hypothetical protein